MGQPQNIIRVGSTIRAEGRFYTLSGVLTNPSTVTLKFQKPDGTITDPAINSGWVVGTPAGVFQYDYEVDQHGKWRYEWEGTGAVDVVIIGRFDVYPRLT